MNIAIVGSGAMGCLYGAYLSNSNNVTMIDALPEQVDSIGFHGITVTEADGQSVTYHNLQASLSGHCRQPMDLVVLFVKSTHTECALEENRTLFGPDTVVMTLQNGAGNDRLISRYVAAGNIVIGTSRHNAVNLGGGRIKHPASGVTCIGSNQPDAAVVAKVAACFAASGLETEVAPDIQRIIWSKLFVNMTVNTLTALVEAPIGYVVENSHTWAFAEQILAEAVEVARADGSHFNQGDVIDMVKGVCRAAGDGYSSMYQDRKRRLKTEIDAINGAVVEQARRYGISTPCNAMLVGLIHAVEGAYPYHSRSA